MSQMWSEEGEAKVNATNSKDGDNNNVEEIVKAFQNGFVTGTGHALLLHTKNWMEFHMAKHTNTFNNVNPVSMMKLKKEVVFGATHTTAALGMFQILRKELRKSNNGMPLTLYQEAWGGLTAGLSGAIIWQPFQLGFDRSINSSHNNLIKTLSHIVRKEGFLGLWKGSAPKIGTLASFNMGMLASYHPCRNYLRDSQRISNDEVQQFIAGSLSGFFAATCMTLWFYIPAIAKTLQKGFGSTGQNRTIPSYIRQILTPNGGYGFYDRFGYNIQRCTVLCVVQWAIFEQVCKMEGSNCKI